MAKNVTFEDLDAPTNLAGSLVAGGTLAANTTYYYRVIAVVYNSTYIPHFRGKSLASEEITITTDSVNKSVELTWNAVPGAQGGFKIYRAEVSEGYPYCINYAAIDSVINIGGTCTMVDNGIALYANNIYQNLTHGKLILSGSTEEDPFSVVDLWEADQANGWGVVTRLDRSTYRVGASIYGHSNMFWKDTDRVIVFADSIMGTSSGAFQFGEKSTVPAYDEMPYSGCRIIFKSYCLDVFGVGTLNAYDTTLDAVVDFNEVFEALVSPYNGVVQIIAWNKGEILECRLERIRQFACGTAGDTTIKDSHGKFYDIFFYAPPATVENLTVRVGSRPFQMGTGTIARAKGIDTRDNTYDILYNGKNAIFTAVNTAISGAKLRGVGDSSGSQCIQLFTYNLNVTDANSGLPLENARVRIWDVFDNLICDGLTDANGDIAEQELIYYEHNIGEGNVITSTKFAPHKMFVSKDLYDSYTEYTDYDDSVATTETLSLIVAPILNDPTPVFYKPKIRGNC